MAITVAELVAKVTTDASQGIAGMRDFGNQMRQAGQGLTLGVTVPIVAAGTAIITTGLNFGTTMERIVGLTDVTADEVDGITEAIQNMAVQTGQAPQELAEAFYFVASAGFEADEALKVLETSAMASAAGLGETQDVAKVLGSVINAYGHENISAAQAADILTEAVSQGTAESTEFASVVGTVVPAAAGLGVSFDQVSAALAGMTLTGLSASESATSLNQIFMSLLKPTKDAEEAMNDMGLSSAGLRQQLKEEGLLATLKTLEERFGGNEDAASKVFGNVRALRGVTSLLTLDSEQLSDVFGKVTDSTGRLAQAYDETEGPQRDLDRAFAEGQVALLELAQTVVPMFVEAIQGLVGWVKQAMNWWNSLDEGTKEMIVTFAAVAAAIGPVLIILGMVVAAIAALFSPIGLIVVALAAFGAAWATNFMGIRDIVATVWDYIVGFFAWFNSIPAQVAAIFSGVVTAIGEFIAGAIEGFQGFVAGIGELIGQVIGFFTGMVETVLGALAEFASKPGYYVGLAIGSIIGWFVRGVQAAIDFGIKFVQNVVSFFQQLPGKVATWLSSMWTQITSWFGRMATDASTKASGLISSVVTFFASLPGKAMSAVADLLPKLITFLAGLPGKIRDAALNIGESIVRGIWRGVSSMFGWLWDQVTGFVSGIIDGVKGALGMHSPSKVFADIGKNMALGLGEGFTRSFDRVGNEVVGAVGQMVPALAPTTAMGDMGGGGTTVILYADRYMGSAQEARYYSDMIARQIKFGG